MIKSKLSNYCILGSFKYISRIALNKSVRADIYSVPVHAEKSRKFRSLMVKSSFSYTVVYYCCGGWRDTTLAHEWLCVSSIVVVTEEPIHKQNYHYRHFLFFIVVLVLRVNERLRHVRKRSHDDYHRNTRVRTVVVLRCTQTHNINKHTNTGCAIIQSLDIFR